MATATKVKSQRVTIQLSVTTPSTAKPTQISNAIDSIIKSGIGKVHLPPGCNTDNFKIAKSKAIPAPNPGSGSPVNGSRLP